MYVGKSARALPIERRGTIHLCLGVAAALALGLPAAAAGQVTWGGHVAHADDAFGGSYGAGLRAGLDLPALPFDLMASGEYFFPDCGADESDCGLHGLSLDANFRMVFPVLRPYITGGIAYRSVSPGGDAQDGTETGLAAGGGVDVSLGGVRAFAELRYEFVNAPEKQFLWRIGLLFGP